jgi:nucleoside-diphosphate-sugar epimerase
VSRIVVIGATGHVGSYLVPRLVRAGHEVVALSRGERQPYVAAPEWRAVERVTADREAEDAAGRFGERIAALGVDAVIDMLCFTRVSAEQLVESLRASHPLHVHCGTIWVHGAAAPVPVTEDEPRTAFGAYGTGKAEIEALLHRETIAGGVPSIVLHPGHITGPWPSITPAGNLDRDVWRRLATGEPVALPELGLGILHHVHGDDVAQAFEQALSRPSAIGASFHVVAEQAMTLRGLAQGVAGWFGREANVELLGWPEFERRVGSDHAGTTREHVSRSIAASIEQARAVLGYRPRYTALEALRDSVRSLAQAGELDLGGQPL